MRDPIKAKACKRRYLLRKKAEKYGPEALDRDMRGRHGKHARGPQNGRWNEGKIISSDGYVKVRVGLDHPLADPNGYAYEHLLVWLSAGRTPPGEGELLHHRDECKQNNRLGNLEIKPRDEHGAHHIKSRQRDSRGRLLPQ